MPTALSKQQRALLHDETKGSDGHVLPNWQQVLQHLDNLPADRIEQTQKDIARQLRANGIAYSPLSEANHSQRPWNLDLAPFIIEPREWARISSALKQRARLKQALFQDIYSEQSLMKQGVLPPTMVFAHAGYLRDAVNTEKLPQLPLHSIDISRSPSGDWYVVDDICQYPSGIGYAVENRLVLARTLPTLFRQTKVVRVASYFKAVQQYISNLSDSDDRCVMLAYGPEHPHYFEFVFLAKYLGYTLVQPADLTVRENRVFLKTVAGLRRVSTILRFISDTRLDPMAIGQSSTGGITGLFEAVRTGGVNIINPIGTGILENPALNVCLPELSQRLLGEPLQMQGPPTYWLGDEQQRQHVMNHPKDLLFRDIDSQGALFDPSQMSDEEFASMNHSITMTPERFVAQERLDRSFAPAYEGTQRVDRQITVRMYLFNSGNDFDIMPGGLCLLDTDHRGRRQSFDNLSGSKDTWVLTQTPARPVSLLNNNNLHAPFTVIDGELPSRVAENLFWMGRHAERCETSIRLLRSIFQTLRSEDTAELEQTGTADVSHVLAASLRATTLVTNTQPGFAGRGGQKRIQHPQKELLSLLRDPERAGTLPFALEQLQNSAASVRDRISDELLLVLNKLDDARSQLLTTQAMSLENDDSSQLETVNDLLDDTLMVLSAFAGLAHENFTHGDGWRFMMLGRRLERVQHTSVIINSMLSKESDDVLLLEALLKLFDSVMTYRSRYRSQINAQLVLQLLLLDEFNPRSIAFQFNEIDKTISSLPGRRDLSQTDPLRRLTVSGLSRVRLADPAELLEARKDARQNLPRLLNVLEQLPRSIATVLAATYFSHVENTQQLAELRPDNKSGS